MSVETGWFSQQVATAYTHKLHDTSPSENQINKLYYHDPFFLSLFPNLNGRKTLDAGCGDFYLGELLKMSYPDSNVYGIDTPSMTTAFAAGKKNLVGGNAQNMPFADSTFGVTYSSLVLHWIQDHHRMLSECHRILEDGGMFIASLANPKGFKAGVHHTSDNGVSYHFQKHPQVDVDIQRTERVMLSSTIGPVTYYARPADDYVEVMEKVGYRNIKIFEPTNEANPYQKQFITLRKWQQVPLFLFITAEK